MRFSNSELSSFRRCRRQWWLGTYRRLKPLNEERGSRSLGNVVHGALSVGEDELEGRPAWQVWLRDHLDMDLKETPEGLQKAVTSEYDMAEAMVEGYFQWVTEEGMDEDLEELGTEQVVEVPFGEHVLVGKLDRRLRRRSTGAVLFQDYKTIGTTINEQLSTIDLWTQPLHYMLIYRLMHGQDTRIDGALYRFLRRVKRGRNAKPPFFGEHDVYHTEEELRAYWWKVYGQLRDLEAARAALDAGADDRVVAYPSPQKSCSYDCDFRAVCPLLDQDRRSAEAMLGRYFYEGDPLERYNDSREREV